MGIVLAVVVLGGYFLLTKNPYQALQQPTQKPQTKVEANTITIQNFAFNPGALTVKIGTKVTWVNQNSAAHNIKSDSFNSTDLNQGDKFEFTFNTKGSFDYICGIHPAMKGKIVVE